MELSSVSFKIVPKKKRTGLMRGQIWIDSATGIVVHQEGRFVKRFHFHSQESASRAILTFGADYLIIASRMLPSRLDWQGAPS